MLLQAKSTRRRGSILPMVAICCVALMGMVALAIDIGVVAMARNQCQNAADAASMAGARTINGDSSTSVNYNIGLAPTNAVKAATSNKVFGTQVTGTSTLGSMTILASDTTGQAYYYQTGNVKIKLGAYMYVYNDSTPSAEGFQISMPKTDATEPYSAVEATVDYSGSFSFGRVFGLGYNTTATATAVHRPRDVMIIMDLSGSMRFQSLPARPYTGSRTNSMNPETIYPEFGHYSDTSTAAFKTSGSYATGSGEYYDPANISMTTDSGPCILEYFFKNASGVVPSSSNRAFSRASDSYNTTPGGDNYLKKTQDTSTTYAKTVSEVVSVTSGDIDFERNGYDAYRATAFAGYTQGPGYWGKTFFIWPPDPRGPTSTKNPSTGTDHADNGSKDWRQRFFFKVTSGGTLKWCDQNGVLFDSSGKLNTPMSDTRTVTENGSSVTYTYRINYAAIFKWLADNPAPIPSILRAGRIKYFDDYPDWTDGTLNNRLWTTASDDLTNLNERFWKGYVDFVLYQLENGAGSYTGTSQESKIGNGPCYSWGTVSRSDKPTPASTYQTGQINLSGGYSSGTAANTNIAIDNLSSSPAVGDYIKVGSSSTVYKVTNVNGWNSSTKVANIKLDIATSASFSNNDTVKFYTTYPDLYMNYSDNPSRPRHHFWFGPMTMYDYLGNYNQSRFFLPGNIPEAQAWSCKAGIQSAIDDIKNNHPNDFIGMTYFSSPRTSRTDSSGQHNKAVVPIGRNYTQLKDSLWFPPTTVTGGVTEITPWDEDFRDVPRANGSTAPGMGFMIVYNQFSSSVSNLRTYATPSTTYRGSAGGLGRKGANRMIIFETDGAPNYGVSASIGSSGSNSYYKIRIAKPASLSDSSNTEWPSNPTYTNTTVYNVVDQIVALDTATTPGYSTTRKPVQIHCIGYGTLFDPANSGDSDQSDALTFLQTIQYKGNTATNTTGSNFPTNQRIYGTSDQRITRMQAAFTSIMQSGVQVSLIK